MMCHQWHATYSTTSFVVQRLKQQLLYGMDVGVAMQTNVRLDWSLSKGQTHTEIVKAGLVDCQ